MHKFPQPLVLLCAVILLTLAAFGAYSNTQAAATKTPVPTKTPRTSATPRVTLTSEIGSVGTLALGVEQTLGASPRLALIDTDGKNFKTLGNFTDVFQVAWSPDGQHLAFVDSSMQIVVVDPDGSNPKTVTNCNEAVISFTWTPDSKQLTFVCYQSPATSGPLRVVSVDLATGKEQILFNLASLSVTQILWSPDGRLVYIEYTGDMPTDAEIHIVDATGSNDHTVVRASGLGRTWLMWSPDSTKLAYCGWSNNTLSINIIDITSKKTQTIQVTCGDSGAWSPDGTQFAYTDETIKSGSRLPGGLSVVSAADGQPRNVAIPPSDQAIIYSISWRPTISDHTPSATAAATTISTAVATTGTSDARMVEKLVR